MKSKIGSICLLLILIFLIGMRFHALSLPYFWDELGVYSRAALYLLDNGISILPESLPPELSRGHPMLFVFLISVVFKVFGATPFVAHSFMLLVSMTYLVSIFYIFLKISNKYISLVVVIITVVQPFFLAQSAMLLPEVLLGFFTIWSFHFFIHRKYILYVLVTGLAIWTKETAILIPVSFFVSKFIYDLNSGNKLRDSFVNNLKFLLPLLFFILFLMIQKSQNGWYLFPYHTEMLNFSLDNICDKLFRSFFFFFIAQGRFVNLLVLLIGVFILLRNKVQISLRNLAVITFLAVYFLFVSVNFYMNRYHILVTPFIFLFVSKSLFEIFKKNKYSLVFLFVMIVSPLLNLYDKEEFHYDVDLNYEYSLYPILELDEYLKKNDLRNEGLLCDFPIYYAFEDPRFGYTDYTDYFLDLNFSDSTNLVLKTNPGSNKVWVEPGEKPLKTFNNHYSKIYLYKIH